MSGIVVFPTLAAAVSAGFELYDNTPDGYLVRARTSNGWAFALARRDGQREPAFAKGRRENPGG
jgi:hypothetical protein